LFDWLRRGLTRRHVEESSASRRVRVQEEPPPQRFLVIIQLMIIFFAGLIGLEVVYMIIFRDWSDVIFNGIMLIVGTIVGAIWGRNQA
jgi:hypothetical protein